MAYPFAGQAYFTTAEGPEQGRPIFVLVEFQDTDMQDMGLGNITLTAREGTSLAEIDDLTARMRRLLTGEVLIQRPAKPGEA